tara:strand:+ start:726 stop:1832 length:1107 start_codon:yes stop_codon:yes gene_type:complete
VISPRFDIDVQWFLSKHWQKKPLLIRSALPGFEAPISPEELAGLAMEAEVDSRIVSRQGKQWQLTQGPFSDDSFERTGEWSLLVQRVDEWFPEVAALRGCVDFIPSWRMDDVMVSYATDGAGVGPHFDQYDVFLLQGAGKRYWKVGPLCDHTTPVIESGGLKLIEEFESSQTFVLEPGDVLYVPPGFAHWGSAIGESMTFSLGFRATPMTDLVARLSDNVIESLREDLLLEDLDSLSEQSRPGEITPQQIQNAHAAVVGAIEALASEDWFPELLSEAPVEPIPQPLPLSDRVMLSTRQRLLWRDAGDVLIAYLGGETHCLELVDQQWLSILCSGGSLSTASLDTRQHDIVAKWWLLGYIEEPELGVAH